MRTRSRPRLDPARAEILDPIDIRAARQGAREQGRAAGSGTVSFRELADKAPGGLRGVYSGRRQEVDACAR